MKQEFIKLIDYYFDENLDIDILTELNGDTEFLKTLLLTVKQFKILKMEGQ
jgi:hypothetical protein